MEQKNIERKLRAWFALMLKKYTWLSIKFEFNKEYKCYLVSFSPSSKSTQDEDFCRDVLDFEDKINEEYEFDAPLFCDDEDLFELSSNAEVLSNLAFSTFAREFSAKMTRFNLQDVFVQNTDTEVDSDEFCYDNQKYDMAA